LDKSSIYKLCDGYHELILPFKNESDFDLLQQCWENFDIFVEPMNSTEKYDDPMTEKLCKAMQKFQDAAVELLSSVTPYVHWIGHIKSQIRKDKAFGIYSTQKAEEKHITNKKTYKHSSKGGGGICKIKKSPEEKKKDNQAHRMKKEIRAEHLKKQQSMKSLFLKY